VTTEMESLRPLGAEALSVRRIRVLIESLLTLAGAAALMLVIRRWTGVELPWWGFVPVVVAAAAVAWWWAGVDHSRWAWRLTPDLFEVRHGVLVSRSHLVPRSRIQNVTTTAGPLQRRYGVVTLTVHTAGARTRNVSIEDLDAGHAEGIRRRLGLA
jgi:membrane protein YdbS with pleckstrin-like domain